jgi:hypothetical protein
MILTKEQLDQIEKLAAKYEVIQLLWEDYKKYQQDPSTEYYLEVVEMTKALAKEMRSVRNPEKKEIDGKMMNVMDAPILLCEDKLFDRIKVLLTDSEKIFAGIFKGKQELNKTNEDTSISNAKKDKISKLHEGKALI